MKTQRPTLAPIGPAMLAAVCVLNLGLGTPILRAAEPVWPTDPTTQPRRAYTNNFPPPTPRSTVVPFATLEPVPERARSAAENSSASKARTLYSFHAEGLDLKLALALFARANNLNIVPDGDITGIVTMDIHGLTLEEMMRAFLESGDCSWHEEGGLIRVRNMETRTFVVDYLRLARSGLGHSSATLSSATANNGSGSSGSGGSSGGGGGGGGGSSSSGSGSSGNLSSSDVSLTADNKSDFWQELTSEIRQMLSVGNRATMAINKTAGIIQISDRPSVLRTIEHYLNATDQIVHRQVDIEARIYDVTLNDQFQFGIDWVHVVESYGGALAFGGATLPVATGGISPLAQSSLAGINPVASALLGTNISLATLAFTNMNTAAAVNALKTQGNVEVIAKPRIRALNNQTALIKVGEEIPFFSQTTLNSQSAGGNLQSSGDIVTTVTVGTILSITPQISDDDWISMDISPVLTSLVDQVKSPSGTATAPVLDTKQASTLVRVRDGTTIVLGGLIQTSRAKNDNKIPLLGDIPYVGWLFQGHYDSKQKKELVIFVTPHIVREGEASAMVPRVLEMFPKDKVQVLDTLQHFSPHEPELVPREVLERPDK